ncbi:MAG TPA: response regulator [Spirochaetota bacterium]|nr:response regulator [Spirochaetota bacterium]
MNDKKSILIVEDDFLTAYWIVSVVKNLGYHTLEPVDSGERAIEIAALHKPDFIIMDIWLAGVLNGIETAGEIARLYDASIIFISGYSEEELAEQCRSITYSAFLSKPLDRYDLENFFKNQI